MLKYLSEEYIKKSKFSFFVKIEKGELIYDIESLLLYEYDFYYNNSSDPAQETFFEITDVTPCNVYFELRYDTNLKLKTLEKHSTVYSEDWIINNFAENLINSKEIIRYHKTMEILKKINP